MSVDSDERYMKMALSLARKGEGGTSPNPMVGAVLVKEGRVIGAGWYAGPGTPHAERASIEEAGSETRGATLFVTLEPCTHHGRTPPCTEAVLESGVTRVVAAMEDPDPRVAGAGLRTLEEAGIEVTVGSLRSEATRLNEAYVTHRTEARPFVIHKSAITLDGKVAAADGSSKWITSEEARRDVHLLRGRCDAVCVGIGSVLRDDPSLTVRVPHKGREPMRVIVDSGARTPNNARVLSDLAPTLIYTVRGSDEDRVLRLKKAGADVSVVEEEAGRVSIKAMLEDLARRGVLSLLLEGGPTLAGAFAVANLIDKYIFYIAPKLLGEYGLPAIRGWTASTIDRAKTLLVNSVDEVGEDLRVTAYPRREDPTLAPERA